MTRILAIVALATVVCAILGLRIALRQQPDEEMIRQALWEAAKASREGPPGGVFEFLSQDLRVNQVEVDQNRQLADFIRDIKPSVEFVSPTIEVLGDRARVVSTVNLRVFPMPTAVTVENVTVELAQETKMRWLVFPGKQWRIVKVQAPPDAMERFMVR